jgi:hypothetical protein
MSDHDCRTSEEVLRDIDSRLARIADALEGLLLRQEAREEQKGEGR